MTRIKLLADENIPDLDFLCQEWCDIARIAGRQINSDDLKNVDLLLVRSVTQVDQQLLAGTRVKFVGTATIGVDHVDTSYLQRKGIGFAHAPGCNANAVVDYVMSAILDQFTDAQLGKVTIGIVGHGNVGSRLSSCLRQFGISYRVYDPFLGDQPEGSVEDPDAVLSCDVVTFHVPELRTGPYRTFHLLDSETLKNLNPAALLINTSRGSVIDNNALHRLLVAGSDLSVVLDVWENEPNINVRLVNEVMLSTPHVAGYSEQGKRKGSIMVVDAAARFFHAQVPTELQFSKGRDLASFDSLMEYRLHLSALYSAAQESQRFRSRVDESNEVDIPIVFDEYRKHYRRRSEIHYR